MVWVTRYILPPIGSTCPVTTPDRFYLPSTPSAVGGDKHRGEKAYGIPPLQPRGRAVQVANNTLHSFQVQISSLKSGWGAPGRSERYIA